MCNLRQKEEKEEQGLKKQEDRHVVSPSLENKVFLKNSKDSVVIVLSFI